MIRQPLSVLIHTYNEADQIEDCIRSVSWADEIYLLDSFSTDGTVELVQRLFPQVRIERHTSLGSAAQKNYGMDRTRHPWILVIDADERVPEALASEIQATLENPRVWAFSIGRRNIVMGREVRHSGLQNDRVTRLFHRAHARYPNRRVHADLVVDGEVSRLRNRLDHLYVRSFNHMASKMMRYGVWSAAQMYLDGQTASVPKIVARSLGRFFRDYLLRLGILDGYRGLMITGMHAFYVFWKYGRLRELHEMKKRGIEPELPPMETDPAIWARPWEDERVDREPAGATGEVPAR